MQRIIRFSSLFILAIALASVAAADHERLDRRYHHRPDQAAVSNATVKVTDESKSFTLSATTDGEGASSFRKFRRAHTNCRSKPPASRNSSAPAFSSWPTTSSRSATSSCRWAPPARPSRSPPKLVQAESAERSYAVQGEVVRNIAVNGRNFAALASIAAGLVTVAQRHGGRHHQHQRQRVAHQRQQSSDRRRGDRGHRQ